MRFAADRTVGKLAKWLRILGYDTIYTPSLSDEEFLELSQGDRVLLSRNTQLRAKTSEDKLMLVQADHPATQIQDLVRAAGLKPDPRQFFTLCTVCNGRLKSVKAIDAVGKVPDHVWTEHDSFSRCQGCGKIYWPGSHTAHTREEIRQLLGV